MRPHGKYARVNTQDPEAFAQCDRCGFWRNRSDLRWQFEWGGMQLYNKQTLICKERCYDTPQEQLRTIIIPPDPPPVLNARVPNYEYEEQTPIIMQFAPDAFTTGTVVNSDFNSDFNNDFGPANTNTTAPLGVAALQPPWGAGPQLIMCDQTGEIAYVLQYLTSS